MSEAIAALTGDNGGGQQAAATPAAASPAQGAAPKVWSADFDEQTAAYVQNKGWQSPTDLLTSYRNLEKFAGGSKNLLELPGADAEPDAWGPVYDKLGRPESPDKYSIQPPEGGDPELTNFYKQIAHKNGLSDKQATAIFNDWNKAVGERMANMQQQMEQQSAREVEALRQEWGQAYEQQITSGRKAVAALGLNAEQLSNYEAKLGSADMLRLFATLGSKMGEPAFEGGERGSGDGFTMTPAQAQAQVAELKANKEFMDAYLKGDKGAVGKMQRLMGAAYAG